MAGTHAIHNDAFINSLISGHKGKPSSKQEEQFIRVFYDRVPEEDLENEDKSDLYSIASSVFAFIQERKSNTLKLRLYSPAEENKNWQGGEYTLVEMVNDDMPFLVDSATEVLNRLGLSNVRTIHPIVNIIRDAKGNLQEVTTGDKKTGALAESIIQFKIPALLDKKTKADVEQALKEALGVVRLSVEDWKDMVAQVDVVLDEIAESQSVLEKNLKSTAGDIKNYVSEVNDFLAWLRDNNFTFLGYVKYDFVGEKKAEDLKIIPQKELGIFRGAEDVKPKGLNAVSPQLLHFVKDGSSLIEITKANSRSLVHRPVHMDYIGIKRFDEKGTVIGEHRFLGLFTSVVYYQSAKLIPLIRQKMASVLDRSGYAYGGHSRKELASILEAFPRDELFQISEDELYETCMGIVSLAVQRRVRLFVRKDRFERFMSCIVFVPRERFSTQLRERIQVVLEKSFQGSTANHYTQVTDSPLARLHVIIRTAPGAIPSYNIAEIEEKIAETSRVWEDVLHDRLHKYLEPAKVEGVYTHYSSAFPVTYKEKFSPYHAYWDIKSIEETYENQDVTFDLYETSEEPDLFHLKIYTLQHQLFLSDVMPILENMGLHILDEYTYEVAPSHIKDKVWVHHFRLDAYGKEKPKLSTIQKDFEATLAKVWSHEMQNDGFNQLILHAGLQWREVVLLRAYSKYLRQAGFTYSQDYIEEALKNHPKLAKLVISLFNARFDPALEQDRKSQLRIVKESIDHLLAKVSDISEDRIIRRFVDVTNAILRTNFFQKDGEGKFKKYISFKINSSAVPDLPLPVPYREIFVYSARVEAIHLRGGKVARGGLRWSDRREDFRTEVLGLMKAQMTKNSVIVPVGSKGGFVVKQPPADGSREAFIKEGIECYKTFLRGLLDVTDNIVEGTIVPPQEVVRHDEDDPYLVVAADKGTATFSDIANGISQEYGFWLGDAFASGGSVGYDHKKMGITARGAWVSVQRHFREMGIDIQKEDFTVAGIGDMAGDVFGNGMLLSEHIRLVAAFNHMHIFLDPNPDAAKSFKERKRLFELPRSSWEDYDSKLISQGGGVFKRSEKSIKLSKEIQDVLDIKEGSLSPDELIKAILKSPVDLIWNGGIGTYVKSENETHAQVGDKANDALRVNGKQLRAKAFGEGGNLGLTQRGRIEYALRGGRINTDAIDNSAGVDCSDHEVNIKIALGQAIQAGDLTAKTRDSLLEEMTEEVAQLVLRDNILQTQAITIADQQGSSILEQQQRLMKTLEADGLLNREIEFLPDDAEIARRKIEKVGLTRPELAVLLSYSKLSIYDNILKSNLPDEQYFVNNLVAYFPKPLQMQYRKYLEGHQLRREITATYITNSMVNRMGSNFFHSVIEDTGLKGCDVARSYVIVKDVYGLNAVWKDIESLDGKVSVEAQAALFFETQKLIERVGMWFLRNSPQPLDVATAVSTYSNGVEELYQHLDEIMSPIARSLFEGRLNKFLEMNVPEVIAKRIAGLQTLGSACDIVKVAQKGTLPVHQVGKLYFELGSRLSLGLLRSYINELPADGYWDRLSYKTLTEELFDQQMDLTADVLKENCSETSCGNAVENWCKKNEKQVSRYDQFINDLKSSDHIDFSMLVVAAKRVEAIVSSKK